MASKPYDDSKRPPPSKWTIQGVHGSVEQDGLLYLSGFGGYFQSEALPNALPIGQHNPQVPNYGAIAELMSGTTFTTPRAHNQRTWMYRLAPSAGHPPFEPISKNPSVASADFITDFTGQLVQPSQFRWAPFPIPDKEQVDFVQGVHSVCGCGSPELRTGLGIHIYTCNTSMKDKGFASSDGDILIVPQQGTLHIQTEAGKLIVHPGHIVVIPRGLVFSVDVDGPTRGYFVEVYNSHFKLPELGPIGSNGLANPRDFLYPVACFEDRKCDFTIVQKFGGALFSYTRDHSPFDVIAWHGNYLPYMYDLNKFVPAGAVRVDHLDPSIFTVLTAPTAEPGVAAVDFVIFPPRWAVQEHTFRPPYAHRNVASEFMGNIYGRYEAKPDGFLPGGASLHSPMVGHGPDSDAFKGASTADTTKAVRLSDDSMSFMFESAYMLRATKYSIETCPPDPNYHKCWSQIPRGNPNKDATKQ